MIKFFKHSDIRWGFDDSNKPWLLLDMKPYPHHEYVDPFPCYSHDEELVKSEVARIEEIVKFPYKPEYFVTCFEGLSRTNGYAAYHKYHKQEPKPYIVLHGKRIPIMPAMTRYLVSHEAGHVVHYSLKTLIALANKKKDDDEEDEVQEGKFESDYAKMRNIELNKGYGGQKWHTNIGEVIANDIRVVLFNAETEFWPHPYPHPLKDKNVIEYWNKMKNEYFK